MFAERIKELRKEKGLTQIELAEAMKLSKGTVAMWEVGKREANFQTLSKLADYFQVPVDYLLGLSNSKSNDAYTEYLMAKALGPERKYEELFKDIRQLDDYGYILIEKVVTAEKQRCFEMDSLRDPVSGGLLKPKTDK